MGIWVIVSEGWYKVRWFRIEDSDRRTRRVGMCCAHKRQSRCHPLVKQFGCDNATLRNHECGGKI